MNEFKPGQLVRVYVGNDQITFMPYIDYDNGPVDEILDGDGIPTEDEARELMPQVFEELDALRAENERLKNEVRQKELIHLGYTNGAQISYIKEESGNIYPDTENECFIPVYMLKIHEHRRLNDLKKFELKEKPVSD